VVALVVTAAVIGFVVTSAGESLMMLEEARGNSRSTPRASKESFGRIHRTRTPSRDGAALRQGRRAV
jgi:hypothetical protein